MENFKIGQTASMSKTISEFDVYAFAGISGDFNPVHIDEVYASNSMFKRRVAHGMLTAGFLSTVLGTKLPGVGSVYISQTLKFTAPVYIGDTITATCTINEILYERNRIILNCTVKNQDGKEVLAGQAVMLIPKEVTGE